MDAAPVAVLVPTPFRPLRGVEGGYERTFDLASKFFVGNLRKAAQEKSTRLRLKGLNWREGRIKRDKTSSMERQNPAPEFNLSVAESTRDQVLEPALLVECERMRPFSGCGWAFRSSNE